jgi:hypothetical protein
MCACAADLSTFYEEQLETKQEQLIEANATLTELTKIQIQSFLLDTTEGEQRATRVKILDMKELINQLEKEITQLIRKLQGCGNILNLNLRRTF